MTVNAFWVHRADAFLDKGNIRGMRMMNYIPSGFLALVLYGVPAFAMVQFGGDFAQRALAAIHFIERGRERTRERAGVLLKLLARGLFADVRCDPRGLHRTL